MVIRGSRQTILLNLGFVLFATHQQGVPVSCLLRPTTKFHVQLLMGFVGCTRYRQILFKRVVSYFEMFPKF